MNDSLEIYAQWDGCELDVVATEIGLLGLASSLRSGLIGSFVLEERDAHPGCENMLRLEIQRGEGKLHLKVEGHVMILSGGRASLSLLADNLDFLRSQWVMGGKPHLHFDPSSNPFLLSQESESFIVGAFQK